MTGATRRNSVLYFPLEESVKTFMFKFFICCFGVLIRFNIFSGNQALLSTFTHDRCHQQSSLNVMRSRITSEIWNPARKDMTWFQWHCGVMACVWAGLAQALKPRRCLSPCTITSSETHHLILVCCLSFVYYEWIIKIFDG